VKLKLLKCDWGMEHLGDVAARFRAYAHAGYDGVEAGFVDLDAGELRELLQELRLDHVPMVFARDEKEFAEQLNRLRRLDPILVNCQAGRDHFSFERGLSLLRTITDMAHDALGCEIVFETHRQTLLYAPWTTCRYLDALPELRLTADFSHFTCVSETDMQALNHAVPDPAAIDRFMVERRADPELAAFMGAAIDASHHIHARVGWSHGPQVADPTTRSGLEWTERFEAWWDRIIENCLEEGRPFLTINPEFGPPPYAPTHPATGAAFIDPWDACLWMTTRFRERWNGRLEALAVDPAAHAADRAAV
jgi:hypothetical protein